MAVSDAPKKTKKKRVGAYLRVSTQEQAKKGFSLAAQAQHIKALVEANKYLGWELTEIYEDKGVSGSLADRPALNRLMNDVRHKKLDIVVVWKIDRLFRNTRHLLETVEELGRYNVDFKSISEPVDTSAVGRFVFQIFGALAEFERNMIRDRTMDGRQQAVQDGYYVGTNVPYGYRVEGGKKRRKLVVDAEEARWVRQIFRWFAYDNWTPERIAVELTAKRVLGKKDKKRSKSGKPSRTTNDPCYWNGNSIRKLLKATNYIGWYFFGPAVPTDQEEESEGTDDENEGELQLIRLKGSCPSIVTPELFRAVASRLEKSRLRSHSAKTPYLFSGKIECGKCSSRYTGYVSMKDTKNYRCLKNNKTRVQKHCTASGISEKMVDAEVWPLVEACMRRPGSMLARMERELRQRSLYNGLLVEKESILSQLEQYKKSRSDVRTLHRDGHLTADELRDDLTVINARTEQLEKDLERIESQLTVQADKEEKVISLQQMKRKYEERLERLTYEDKRDILQELVGRVVVQDGELTIELRVPKVVQEQAVKYKYSDGVLDRN